MALYKHQKTVEMKKELNVYSTLANETQNGKNYIFVKNKSRLIKISVEDLFYIEALKDYVNFYSRNGKYTIHSTMKDVESKLPSKYFARVHIKSHTKIAFCRAIKSTPTHGLSQNGSGGAFGLHNI